MRFLVLLIPCLALSTGLWARKSIPYPGLEMPWLTGPLIAPSSSVVPYGHFNIEPYLNTVIDTGSYNENWRAVSSPAFYSNSFVPFIQVGLTSWMDFQFSFSVFYNYTEGVGSWTFGDIPVVVDFQLYSPGDPLHSWIPEVKLSLRETFPTGKYDQLDPKKKKTDVGGNGSFISDVGLVFGKLIHFGGVYFLSTRLFLAYSFPSPVRLKGFNAYGGGEGVNTRFFPSQNAKFDFAFELTLSRNWALAMDIIGKWAKRKDFSAAPGTGLELETSPSSGNQAPAFQYSLAPAIEYNWNEHLGVIAGSWFTIAGKNTVQFYSGIFAVNYYY